MSPSLTKSCRNCLLLIGLCCYARAAEYVNPCPNILSFKKDGCGFAGIFKVPNDYSGEYVFKVNASWVGIGSDVKDLGIDIANYGEAANEVLSHIIYVVTYPVCKYFPKITRATFNGVTVCSGPGDQVTSTGVTSLSITSRMSSSKQKEGANGRHNAVLLPKSTVQAATTTTKKPVVVQQRAKGDEEVCGVVNEIIPFIINGVQVKEGEFPWMVALFYFKTSANAYEFICTSNLISKRHILTAAHCVVYEKEDFIVVLGKASLVNWAIGAKTAQVSKIYSHPNYEKGKSGNDLAIFALRDSVPLGNNIRPICLWKWGHSTDWLISNGGTTAGWGRADDNYKYSYQLNKIKINVVSTETCESSRWSLKNAISDRTFCGRAKLNSGPCTGDSGGGFFIENQGKFYLRGVVSSGVSANSDCNVNEYTVFADIYKNMEWIDSIIS